MKNHKRTVFIFLTMLLFSLAGCSFQPKLGMTFEEWNRECRMKNLTNGTLVKAEGAWEVYYCDNTRIFHYFNKGVLVKIDQGELDKQKFEIKIIQ